MKTGLPVPIVAVRRLTDHQPLIEFGAGKSGIGFVDRKQVGVFRDAPTFGILLMNHPVDRHHHAFASGEHRVGIGSALGRVVTQDVLGRIPAESVHPKLI